MVRAPGGQFIAAADPAAGSTSKGHPYGPERVVLSQALHVPYRRQKVEFTAGRTHV